MKKINNNILIIFLLYHHCIILKNHYPQVNNLKHEKF